MMRRRNKWRDSEVARYLLAHSDYKRWELLEADHMAHWITLDGTKMLMMDDDDERAAAVDRFISSRKSVSRTDLEKELEDEGERIDYFDISSVLFGPFNLFTVKQVLEEEFPTARISIYTSGHNGAKTIHLRGVDADFKGHPESIEGTGATSDYLFEGALETTADAAVAKTRRLFSKLVEAGVDVQFEVYDPNGTTLFEQEPTRDSRPTKDDT